MKSNLFKLVSFSLAGLILFIACDIPTTKRAAFTGQWKHTMENCIIGSKDEETTKVITDGFRYRMENEYSVTVYDGTMLYTKGKDLDPKMFGEGAGSYTPPPAQTTEKKIDRLTAHGFEFWYINTLNAQAKAGAGGNILGQETILYQVRENRPEGELSLQNWVDGKTGVVLKTVHSIYSKQIEQLVSQDTWECIEISYGTVDAKNFLKP